MENIPIIGKNMYGSYVLRNSLGDPSLLGLEPEAGRKMEQYPVKLETREFGVGQMWCNALEPNDTIYKLLRERGKLMIQGD